MIDYMDAMFDNFSTKFKPDDTSPNPESEDLFVYGTTADLDTQEAAEYHTFFSKVLLAYKRYCPDIGPTIAALFTRVKNPNQND